MKEIGEREMSESPFWKKKEKRDDQNGTKTKTCIENKRKV